MNRKPTRKWWSAYAALHGKQGELPMAEKPKRPKRVNDTPTEVTEQIAAATWLTKMNIPFYHIPNGGYRDYIEAAKFKRMGVRAGVPDICIPVARKGHHGLYIELKRVSGGKLSDTQMFWRDILMREGYLWHEAKGAADLIQFVESYLR